MYSNIIEYMIIANNVQQHINDLDLSNYENNKYFFDVQKLNGYTSKFMVRTKELKLKNSERSQTNVRLDAIINSTEFETLSLDSLLETLVNIPNTIITLEDKGFSISLYRSVHTSRYILKISINNITLYIADRKEEKYYIDKDNDIFDFLSDIDSECLRRLVNIKELGIDACKLIDKLKEEQEKLEHKKVEDYANEKIFKYLHTR